MRKEHHQPCLPQPLGLATGQELIKDNLQRQQYYSDLHVDNADLHIHAITRTCNECECVRTTCHTAEHTCKLDQPMLQLLPDKIANCEAVKVSY